MFCSDEVHACDLQERVSSRARGGPVQMGVGSHFSRAGETVARSTDTRRTCCSDPPTLCIRWDRCLNDARQSCNRHTLSPPPPRHLHQMQTDHPSPSAHEFRLLFNGLAASALRRMILQTIVVPSHSPGLTNIALSAAGLRAGRVLPACLSAGSGASRPAVEQQT
jgi:hypothetical protein